MAITSTTVEYVSASVVQVTVVSDLVGAVFYHWYTDGAYVGMTTTSTRTFYIEPGEQVEIEAIDTLDVNFDPIANAPTAYPARRTVQWLRSLEADVAQYRVETTPWVGAGWVTVGTVYHDEAAWSYDLLTERLEDLTPIIVRVVPVDGSGNDGTPLAFPVLLGLFGEMVVRTPDAPNFTATYDGGTQKVTFAEAA
ncbi:MAG: hypothetical protein GY778_19175 [bacterium]|nr:hypothetical protein [bacterium]